MRLDNCYIWDGSVIEDNVTAVRAIVGNQARVKQGATLEKGVILSHRVEIGTGVRVCDSEHLPLCVWVWSDVLVYPSVRVCGAGTGVHTAVHVAVRH